MVKKQSEPCILCLKPIPEKTMPEHILLNALGGRMTVRKVICPNCNNDFGNIADKDLAESTAFIRNICGFEAGDSGDAPRIQGLNSDGKLFDLMPGMKQVPRQEQPMDIVFDGDSVSVKINTFSEKEAEKLIRGATKAIAKRFGASSDHQLEAIREAISKEKKISFHPGFPVHKQMQFGGGKSQHAMAKACLVLWASRVTSAEVCNVRYDSIREFVFNDVKSLAGDFQTVKIDTREVPALPDKFGNNSNFIWVGSDNAGRVFGYYRLYNAIGWRFLLCEQGAPVQKKYCLISNPADNKQWALLSGDDVPLEFSWINANWNDYPPEFEKVQKKISFMIESAQAQTQNDWVGSLTRDAFSKAGCKEGDLITDKHIGVISDYIARAMTALILKVEIPEEE